MVGPVFDALNACQWEKAKWLVQAVLLSNGVSKVESLRGSTKTLIPLSACDLPTLLDTLSETQTSTALSMDDTLRSRLKSAATRLRTSSGSSSESGPAKEPAAASVTPPPRPLSSNRKYWPAEEKDNFWSLVRQLNAYDKESTAQGTKSPLQLSVAEAVIRRCWSVDHAVVSDRDRLAATEACASLGFELLSVVPDY